MQNIKNEKTIVGLVQIACNTIDGYLFIPYSIGLLQSYFKKHSENAFRYEFITPIVTERSISKAIKILAKADIIAFSAYVWNGNISLAIAESIKEINPSVTIIFGGPFVPSEASDFLRQNRIVDLLIHGEGEIAFMNFLDVFPQKDWSKIPGARYIDKLGSYKENQEFAEVSELDKIPSPYLEGVFDHLFKSDTINNWVAVWETNRGCPYHCSFCEWGNFRNIKLRKFGIDRLYNELNWFSEFKIKLLCCCDANFGIFDRDAIIAKQISNNKRRTGFPDSVYFQNAKNSTKINYEIHKSFVDSGLTTTIGLSFQSLNPVVLKNINRSNINLNSFITLQTLFNKLGVNTYCELILGLPGETYDSFVEGLCYLVENGQHNSIRSNNLTVLPNSEMSSYSYISNHKIETVPSLLINPGQHNLSEYDDKNEIQELVCSTATMTRNEWAQSRVFSWLLSFMYFERFLWIPMFIYFKLYQINFRIMIEAIIKADDSLPTLKEVSEILFKKAANIQNGEPEYFYSNDWLGVFWPIGKYIYLKLLFENKLNLFYEEFRTSIFLSQKKLLSEPTGDIINEAFNLNYELLKKERLSLGYPKTLTLNYNFLEYFENLRKGEGDKLDKKKILIRITTSNNLSNELGISEEAWFFEILHHGFLNKYQLN